MQHHKNSRDAASPAPPSQRQTAISAPFAPASWQQASCSALRNSAPTLPAAPQTSPRYLSSMETSSSNRKVSNQRPKY